MLYFRNTLNFHSCRDKCRKKNTGAEDSTQWHSITGTSTSRGLRPPFLHSTKISASDRFISLSIF